MQSARNKMVDDPFDAAQRILNINAKRIAAGLSPLDSVVPSDPKFKAPPVKVEEVKPIIQPADPGSVASDIEAQIKGERQSIAIPRWPRLCKAAQPLRPGGVCIVAGPPKQGKSLFLLDMLLQLHYAEVMWEVLPLEDHAYDVGWRFLSLLTNDWAMMDVDIETATRRKNIYNENAEIITTLMKGVHENPRLPVGPRGKKTVPPFPYQDALEWIKNATGRARVAMVDPLAQIDWGGYKMNEGQSKFMRDVVGIAAESGSTVVLVVHTIKRPGKDGTYPMTPDDLMGCAEFSRLAHSIIMVNSHEERKCNVYGDYQEVEYNRTVYTTSRFGKKAPWGIAYKVTDEGPQLEELGLIKPKERIGT